MYFVFLTQCETNHRTYLVSGVWPFNENAMMDKVVQSESLSAGDQPTTNQSIPVPTNILVPPLDSSSNKSSSSTIPTSALLISSDIERVNPLENPNNLVADHSSVFSQEFIFDMTQMKEIEPVMVDDSELPNSTESILTILDELDLIPTVFQPNVSQEIPTIPITLDHISVVSRPSRLKFMILSIFSIDILPCRRKSFEQPFV